MNTNTQVPPREEEKKKRRKILFWWFSSFLFVGLLSLILVFSLSAQPEDTFIRINQDAFILEEGNSAFVTFEASPGLGDFLYVSNDRSVVTFIENRLVTVGPGSTTIVVSSISDPTIFDTVSVIVRERAVEPELPVEPEPELPVEPEPEPEPEVPVEPKPEVPVVEEPEEEVITPSTIYTITITNETGSVITTLNVEAGSFITTSSLDLPENFKGFFLDEQTCEDEPFDLETPITEDLTLIQASFNEEAPCIQLDYIVLNGRPVAGTTLSVDVFPLGANVTISWYTSVNNRTYREIPGETESTFTVRPEDSGKFIRVYVVSDSNPPVVRYDTIKLDVFGTLSNGEGGGPTQLISDASITALLNQGYIPISSLEDMQAINFPSSHVFASNTNLALTTEGGLSKNYVVVNDIDLSAYTGTTSVVNGTFTGTFEGNGYILSNLKINGGTSNDIALFKRFEGSRIENITLSGFNVTGGGTTSILVGESRGSTVISNVAIVNSVVDASSDDIGGFIGLNKGFTIMHNLRFEGEIAGDSDVGGIVGKNDSSAQLTMSAIINYGKVSGLGSVGGIVGRNNSKITMDLVTNFSTITAVRSNSNSGGIIGINANTLVLTNVFNYGNVTGRDAMGGFVGWNNKGLIDMRIASNFGTVQGEYSVGGIIGANEGTVTMNAISNVGNISSSDNNVGGIIGDSNSSSKVTITHAYNSGLVTTSGSNYGAIFGEIETSTQVAINGVFFLNDSAPNAIGRLFNNATTSGIATGISGISMVSIQTFIDEGWNISADNITTWSIGYQGQLTYPWLSTAVTPTSLLIPEDQGTLFGQLNIIPLASLEDILAINSTSNHTFASGTAFEVDTTGGLSKTYWMIDDIDLSTNTAFSTSLINGTFTGTFNGNGYTLSSLAINASTDDIGLFKNLGNNATIENITLSGFNIKTTILDSDIGLLAGSINATNITVENIHAKNSTVEGVRRVGGLIGYILNSDDVVFRNIKNDFVVTGIQYHVGGLIGEISYSNVVIENVLQRGLVNSDIHRAGGIVGIIRNDPQTIVTMSGIAQESRVEVNGDDAGGIVGNVRSGNLSLSNSYNQGSVINRTSNNSTSNGTGGIIGSSGGSTSVAIFIQNVYQTGQITITGNSPIGNIMGVLNNTSSIVTLSGVFALSGSSIDNVTIGAINNTPSLSGHITVASIAQMTAFSTFASAGWDIERYPTASAIWSIQYNGQTTYPWLTSQGQPHASQIIDVIPVFTGSDLKTIEDNLFGTFELENDIDLASFTNLTRSFIDATFTGNLSGQGFTVSGLSITATINGIGLFTRISDGAISNLTLSGFTLSSNAANFGYGLLAGELIGGNNIIENIVLTNSSISAPSTQQVGGLTGIIQNVFSNTVSNNTLTNISSSVIITASNEIGGIIGNIRHWSGELNVSMTGISFTGSITQGTSQTRYGGIIGYLPGTNTKVKIDISDIHNPNFINRMLVDNATAVVNTDPYNYTKN